MHSWRPSSPLLLHFLKEQQVVDRAAWFALLLQFGDCCRVKPIPELKFAFCLD
jgi:hypothetical protein